MNPDKKVSSPLIEKKPIKQPSILLGLILILNGIGALLWLAISIATNPAISLALNNTQPETSESSSLVMAFLIDFGIILPFLAISAGLILIWLGVKAFSGNITVARWAQVILFWLAIGFVIILIFNLYQILSAFTQQPKIESAIIDRGKILVLISLF